MMHEVWGGGGTNPHIPHTRAPIKACKTAPLFVVSLSVHSLIRFSLFSCSSVNPCIHLCVCLSVHPSTIISVSPSLMHLSIHSSIHPSVQSFIHPSIQCFPHPGFHPTIHLFICPFILPSAHPFKKSFLAFIHSLSYHCRHLCIFLLHKWPVWGMSANTLEDSLYAALTGQSTISSMLEEKKREKRLQLSATIQWQAKKYTGLPRSSMLYQASLIDQCRWMQGWPRFQGCCGTGCKSCLPKESSPDTPCLYKALNSNNNNK